MTDGKFTIVQIDDNQDDICLFAEAFSEWGTRPVSIRAFQSGAEAIRHILAQGPAATDLVVVDLNLPGISGFEVIERIKAGGSGASPPVIVLTTSRSEDDIRESLARGADTFRTKPHDWNDYRDLVKNIETYDYCAMSNDKEELRHE
jgi:CheY-like chemotaxis protein